MKNRIKELRTSLGLTQEKFGAKINVKQATIAAYECGARTPIDAVIGSICKEYSVNEEWLRDGTGEMYRESVRDDEIGYFVGRVMGDKNANIQRRFLAALSAMPDEWWEMVDLFAKKLAEENEES